jgi:hypothetical protein
MYSPDGTLSRVTVPRRWLLVVGLAVGGLLVLLLGVALVSRPSEPCSCSPIPSRSPSSSPGAAGS